MAATVYINGQIFDQDHAVISVFDHGFLYGEGIYETLRTYHGRPFLFERHMRRLRRSADMLALPIPLSDKDLAQRFRETQTAAGLLGDTPDREAYIRLLITRGIGDITYDPAATPHPSVIIIVKPHVQLSEDLYRGGVPVVIVPVVRNHPATVNPSIKSNNLLNVALAAQEAIRRQAFEGVMRNHRGELAECSTSNLFVVRQGAVLTPPRDAGLLPGITREFIFEVASDLGIPASETVMRDDDLLSADEAFLTSSTREVLPIVTVDGRPIGSGEAGPITRRLLDSYRSRAAAGAA